MRFITSVEIPKQQQQQQQQNKTNSESSESSVNKETLNSICKTVVISGGEGYEEYKGVSMICSGISLSNSSASNIFTNQQSSLVDSQNSMMNSLTSNGSMIFSNASLNNGFNGANQQISSSSFSSNCDENQIGKDDLVNYVLTWEI